MSVRQACSSIEVPQKHNLIDIDGAGESAVLVARRAPVPEPRPGEILIRVLAAGVNRADVKQRLGLYLMPTGAPTVPGLEVAGEIVALGAGAERWQVGDRVCALLLGGGYAEYCVVPACQCLPLPEGLNFVQAAALPEALFTIWISIIEQARIAPGETLLVHGGAGGVGSLAVQLASAFGARVIATAGTSKKCEAIADLGAAHVINYREQDVAHVVAQFTHGRGVDVILNQLGANYLARDIAMLAEGGRVCFISHEHGRAAPLDVFDIMFKRITVTGARLRHRSVAEKARIAAELERRVWPLVSAGRIRPLIAGRLPLSEAARAHRMLEEGQVIGKLILEPTS